GADSHGLAGPDSDSDIDSLTLASRALGVIPKTCPPPLAPAKRPVPGVFLTRIKESGLPRS
ncbi:MAG: hypothetical protein ACK4KV_07620, partial [Rhodocyclaceae bacterium]